MRLDVSRYWRAFRNPIDDDVFLNTGLSFPITFASAHIAGTEARLEMPRRRGWSAVVSYSNMTGRAASPVTGGLFIEGGEADELRDAAVSFPISQDQRNTVAAQVRFEPHRRVWLMAGVRYGSGLPVEFEDDDDEEDAGGGEDEDEGEEQPIPQDILDKIDFERGPRAAESQHRLFGGLPRLGTAPAVAYRATRSAQCPRPAQRNQFQRAVFRHGAGPGAAGGGTDEAAVLKSRRPAARESGRTGGRSGVSRSDHYEVYAIKYAECIARTRRQSFIFDDAHDAPHDMDYFIWVVRNAQRTILVDTGFDGAEGARGAGGGSSSSRPRRRPASASRPMPWTRRLSPICITITRAGWSSFRTPACTCRRPRWFTRPAPACAMTFLRKPFTAEHVCRMVRRVYAGGVVFHDGDAEVAPGVSVHKVGGHSRGLQVVRVETERGPLALASDAAHYYENYEARSPFPLVVDVEDMLKGYDVLTRLAGDRRLVIPGHDPLVRRRFPAAFEGRGRGRKAPGFGARPPSCRPAGGIVIRLQP